jgi:dTDP-4-dehydrorhamnose 3,5-epimerase
MTEVVDLSVERSDIDGLAVVTMKQVTDGRGTIREFHRASAFAAAGLGSPGPWVQVNVTETNRGAIRGMHGEQMTKLVAVASGRAHGAYVDARRGSATFGAVVQLELVPGVQVLVPPGVCNGFQALEDRTQFLYCFDVEWQPDMTGVACTPLDPDLGIDWPIAVDPDDTAQVSAKDRSAPRLAELP